MKDYRFEAEAKFPFRGANALDHKAWARRILWREEKGDTTLLPIQVSDAKMAMGIIPMPNGDQKK